MKFKYKMMLGIILLLLTFSIYICFNYNEVMQKIKQVINNESLVFTMEDLSVNFLTGDIISYNGSDYVKEFSITNNSDEDIYYNIGLLNVVNSTISGVNYELTSTNDGRNISKRAFPKEDKELVSKAVIGPGVTQRYTLTVTGKLENNSLLEAKIYVSSAGAEENVNEFAKSILKNNEVKDYITVPGKEISTTNEGLIKDTDDYGDTYYFRGNVDNNYVEFANYKWRIVRITGDGNVKLVLDEDISNLIDSYNDNIPDEDGKIEDMVLFNNSSAKDVLISWYDSNLMLYDDKIVDMKVCGNSETMESDNNLKYYVAYDRIYNLEEPSFKISGTCNNSKISLLTVDEVIFAGAYKNKENKDYYLYNSDYVNNFYTVTPYYLNDITSNTSMFIVSNLGKLSYSIASNEASLRPVIVVNENVKVSGNGTSDNPYVLN